MSEIVDLLCQDAVTLVEARGSVWLAWYEVGLAAVLSCLFGVVMWFFRSMAVLHGADGRNISAAIQRRVGLAFFAVSISSFAFRVVSIWFPAVLLELAVMTAITAYAATAILKLPELYRRLQKPLGLAKDAKSLINEVDELEQLDEVEQLRRHAAELRQAYRIRRTS